MNSLSASRSLGRGLGRVPEGHPLEPALHQVGLSVQRSEGALMPETPSEGRVGRPSRRGQPRARGAHTRRAVFKGSGRRVNVLVGLGEGQQKQGCFKAALMQFVNKNSFDSVSKKQEAKTKIFPSDLKAIVD